MEDGMMRWMWAAAAAMLWVTTPAVAGPKVPGNLMRELPSEALEGIGYAKSRK